MMVRDEADPDVGISHDGLGEEMASHVTQLSDSELGQVIVTSAKQLRFGAWERRELHRRMVQHCLDLLAERGKGGT